MFSRYIKKLVRFNADLASIVAGRKGMSFWPEIDVILYKSIVNNTTNVFKVYNREKVAYVVKNTIKFVFKSIAFLKRLW